MALKYMSFVFDDGPKEPLCSMVDKISSYGWKASFAIVGKKINDETEKQLEYVLDHGFELVSHGWNHVDLTKLGSKQEIVDEMMNPIMEIERRLHYKIKLARLPFIAYNDFVLKTIQELGLPLLGQGIDGGDDWNREKTPESITNAVLKSVSDGAIACLHVTENTSKALDVILPELKKMDYALVTSEELFKEKNIKSIPLGVNIANTRHISKMIK